MNKNAIEVVFVLGGPGSGKRTLCRSIEKEYGYVHLSTTDLLRQNGGHSSGEHSSSIPSDAMVSILRSAMERSGSDKFLIDGFPRNIPDLMMWYDLMNSSGNSGSSFTVINFVIYLELDDNEMIHRLL